ncbi:putative rRna biogenesis protein rrp5, partial [Cardiosporidium cionae]
VTIKMEDFPRRRPLSTPKAVSVAKKKKNQGSNGDLLTDLLPLVKHRAAKALLMPDLSPGTLLLGAIGNVYKHELLIHLPYSLIGYVEKNHSYESTFEETSEWQSLSLTDYFHVGDLVLCVVLSNDISRRVLLSLRPTLINAGLTVKKVTKHMTLSTYIRSKEEHGYLLSPGIPNFSIFLPFSSLPSPHSFNPPMGSLLYVHLTAVNSNAFSAVCVLANTMSMNTVTFTETLDWDTLKPGCLFEGRLSHIYATNSKKISSKKGEFLPSPLEDASLSHREHLSAFPPPSLQGVDVSFCGNLKGFVPFHHLVHPSALGISSVKFRIIAILPVQRTIYLSFLPHILQWTPFSPPLPEKSMGLKLEDASVVHIQSRYGLWLLGSLPSVSDDSVALSQPVLAACHLSRIADTKISTVEESLALHTHRNARVLFTNILEGQCIVSLQPSVWNEAILSPNDLKPGDIVKGEILRITQKELIVKFSKFITTKVPILHLTDIPLSEVSPGFKVGKSVTFRILRYDAIKSILHVTAKKSFLRDKSPLLSLTKETPIGLQALATLPVGCTICQLLLIGRCASGFFVVIPPSEDLMIPPTLAFLPLMHLADDVGQAHRMHQHLP